MEDSSSKINESKENQANVPESFSEKLKENLEKNIKQNVNEYLNRNSMIINNIKSEYTIKIIFSHLDEKIKLKTIKYNKKLQNLIDISLINYNFFAGRYIEFEANGRVKEYDYKGELKFEGEYLNGKRNGKGKEYYPDEALKFEGE